MAGHARTKPEFSRLIATPKPGASVNIAETATAQERAALAERFGALEVGAFSVRATYRGQTDGALLSGAVSARLTQQCVVTMEPVESRIEEPFERRFAATPRDEAPVEFDPEAEDPPEPLGPEIDIGEIAAETAALAIDPYPRAPGAALQQTSAAPPGAAPLDDAAAKPFAGLAALKRKLEGGGEGDD